MVSAVFFYSPTCPHCHEVLDNHWPAIEERFGSQLRTVFVDISSAQGSEIMGQTLSYMGMAPTGVPLLIVGDQAMVGSLEIPERAALVVQAGLDAGGVRMVPIPALLTRLDALIAHTSSPGAEDAPAPDAAVEEPAPDASLAAGKNVAADANDVAPTASEGNTEQVAIDAANPETVLDSAAALAAIEAAADSATNLTIWQRVARDPIANSLALLVLLLLMGSLLLVLLLRLLGNEKGSLWSTMGQRLHPWMLGIVSVLGAALAVMILLGGLTTPAILVLALVQLVAFALLLASEFWAPVRRTAARWMVPIASSAGMLVALYLAYVEATANPAVCGTVGECNLVQQSQYAAFFGIPIGMLGMAGYALILAIALLRIVAPDLLGEYDLPLLELMTVAGVAFSIWLTFLEPFVIGATCAWCLISALWMLALLWLVVRWEPLAKDAVRTSARRAQPGRHRQVRKSHSHAR